MEVQGARWRWRASAPADASSPLASGMILGGRSGGRLMPDTNAIRMPSDITGQVGVFDRFAGWAATIASRAPFFAFCVVLVAGWLIQGVITMIVTGDPHSFLDDQYQLEINTTTTIITFLMVALLQNSQTRESQATQHK